ncbi:GerAB/ArcD/ProY family transporter [Fredinandcohnia humi]
MNKDREFVTPNQLAVIIISTILGVAMLALPRFVVRGAGLGAPIASLIGVLLAFLGLLSVVYLGKRFPKQTVIGYSQTILGNKLGKLISFSIILFFSLLMGLETRQFAEVVAGALLPNTPIHIPIIFMTFLCASSGFQNVTTFAYIHFFYMPLILIPILLVLLPAFQDIEVYHLTPLLGNNPSFKEFVGGGIVVTQAILNFFVITMVIPFMKEPEKCVKSGIFGFLIGSIFVVFIITMTLAVFGENEIQQSFWPTLSLGRMVHVPAQILSRIDSLLLISWIYGVFTTLLSFYFMYVRGVAELFQSERYRLISAIGFPIMFTIAIFPQDIYEMYEYVLTVTCYGIFLTIVYPVFLLIIAMIRKIGGELA